MNACDYQIALLYNEDIQVSKGDPQDLTAIQYTISTTQFLYEALVDLGYTTVKIPVRDSLDALEHTLLSLSPKNTFIFNNCDGFIGNNWAAIQVIRFVEQLGFKHTGAPPDSMELCIDKSRTKERLIQAGVPTPRYQIYERAEGDLQLEYPVIVKPVAEDASMGIDFNSVISTHENLLPRIAYITKSYEEPVVVEEFVHGREFAVALWGNEVVEILPIAEEDYSLVPDPLQCLLTYAAKWDTESPYYHNITSLCPAALKPKEEQIICQAAKDAYRAMGLHDFGRVDIRYWNRVPYVIDINELPDLSPDAGFWNSARTAGHSYAEMIGRILGYALKREGWIA